MQFVLKRLHDRHDRLDILGAFNGACLVSGWSADTARRLKWFLPGCWRGRLHGMKARLKRATGRTAGALALRLALLTLALPSLAAPWVQTTSLPDAYVGQSLVYVSGYLYQ